MNGEFTLYLDKWGNRFTASIDSFNLAGHPALSTSEDVTMTDYVLSREGREVARGDLHTIGMEMLGYDGRTWRVALVDWMAGTGEGELTGDFAPNSTEIRDGVLMARVPEGDDPQGSREWRRACWALIQSRHSARWHGRNRDVELGRFDARELTCDPLNRDAVQAEIVTWAAEHARPDYLWLDTATEFDAREGGE